MTIVKENHSQAGKAEEWRAIRPGQFHRSRVMKFFSQATPDRNGKFGYGFVKPESGGRWLFFCMTDLIGVEVSKTLPEPVLLRVRQHALELPLEEPNVGDFVWYGLRVRPCGCIEKACPWIYERDYEVATQQLTAMTGRPTD